MRDILKMHLLFRQGRSLLFLWEKLMTVSTTTNKISYIGNGVTVEFAIPFPFLDTTHLKVYQLLNDVQSERTDWTVQSGNIVFASAPVSGAHIVILREVPFTQETDYRENEILAAETLERNFDSLTMQVQQLKEKTDRAVTVDVFDDTQASDLLPSIRTAVSDAASYAQTAAQEAADAAQSAQTAEDKAAEAVNTLADKADKNMENLSADGKNVIAYLSMPGSRYTDLTPGVSDTNYTMPSNGYFAVSFSASAAGFVNLAVTTSGLVHTAGVPCGSGGFGMSIPVKSGESVNVWYSASLTFLSIRFIYAQGAS